MAFRKDPSSGPPSLPWWGTLNISPWENPFTPAFIPNCSPPILIGRPTAFSWPGSSGSAIKTCLFFFIPALANISMATFSPTPALNGISASPIVFDPPGTTLLFQDKVPIGWQIQLGSQILFPLAKGVLPCSLQLPGHQIRGCLISHIG